MPKKKKPKNKPPKAINKQPIYPDTKLDRKLKKRLVGAVKKSKWTGDIPKTAQKTIPYEEMENADDLDDFQFAEDEDDFVFDKDDEDMQTHLEDEPIHFDGEEQE